MKISLINTPFLLNRTASDAVLILFCSLLFLIPTIFIISLNDFPIDELIIGVDDWNRYARYAIDINNNGPLIESISGNYLIPAGFLYNYFVAICFYFFGENPAIVYCIQSILLGSTVALTYLIFRDHLKQKTGWLLLFILIVFAFFDVYKYYTFRLLSENFAIFTITLFFFYFKKALVTKKSKLYIFSGLLLGISVLTRPNILPFSILLFLMITSFLNRKKGYNYWLFFFSYIIIISILPLRNFLVSGDLSTMIIDRNFLDYLTSIDNIPNENVKTTDGQSLQGFVHYFKKTLFCLGYLPILEEKYRIRPHWIIMWVGFILNISYLIGKRRKLKLFDLSLLFFVLSFYFIIILIAPITNYGFRFLIPVLFIVLGFSFIGYERLFCNFKKSLYRNKQLTTKPKRH